MSQSSLKPVTVITGATGGIGSALAQSLEDHELILLGRDSGKLEKLCASLPNAKPVVLELKRPEAFAVALEPFAQIDNLILNAGMAELGSVQATPLEVWRETFEVNLFACVELTRVCLDRLRDARGQVVCVNSMAGLQASGGWSAYAASKFALRAFTDALDAEERPHGVRVMGVYPGRTATAMQEKVRAQEGAEYEPETYTKPETLASTIKSMLETPRDSLLTQVIVSRMG